MSTYASFGIPFFVLPRRFNENLVVRPSGGLLFEPYIRARVSNLPKFPLFGKEIREIRIWEAGRQRKIHLGEIQDEVRIGYYCTT